MSLSTQLTRLAQNVGAINADTNAIFEALRAKGVSVQANAQLSDVADMIESIEPNHRTLYLSYFDNFDDSTSTDYPLIGPSSTDFKTDSTSTYNKASMTILGQSVNACFANSGGSSSSIGISHGIDLDISKYDIISAECFAKFQTIRSDYGWRFYISRNWSDHISRQGSSLGAYVTSGTTFYNGATGTQDSFSNFGLTIVNGTIYFLSVVIDRINNCTYYYVNGTLYQKSPRTTNRLAFVANPYGYSTGYNNITWTQSAVFNWNKSTNNHSEYPVPTELYK